MGTFLKMRVSEIRVNQIRVNQGLGVLTYFHEMNGVNTKIAATLLHNSLTVIEKQF